MEMDILIKYYNIAVDEKNKHTKTLKKMKNKQGTV